LDHYDFSGCWTPFWCSNGPNLSKTGLAASILDFHDPTFHFLAAGPLFVLSAVWILQKGVPRNLTSDLPPFPAAWTPFLCRQRPILQKGSCDLESNLLPQPLFR
jgi:hypothetical protein